MMKKESKLFVSLVILSLLLISGVVSAYNEAPMLKELVDKGELPPVDERLPENPVVIEPNDEIGKYGGTLVSNTTHNTVSLLMLNRTTTDTIPNVVESWEFKDEGKELYLYLRKGIKWSDGHPFTTEDIMFFYEDEILNKEIPSWQSGYWTVDGKLADFEAIDDYTIKITFAKPFRPISGMINYWMCQQSNFYDPKHYLKKFHKKYNPDVDKLAKEEGYENWVQLFQAHKDVGPGQTDPGLPVLGAWMLEKRDQTKKEYVRNPYYWAVDSEGNQLPYIDRWQGKIITDQEVAILDVMQGNIDFAGMILKGTDFPMYKKNEEMGNYRVFPWKSGAAGQVTYTFNLNHPDPELKKVFNNKKFRQAMSLALNREEINQFVFLGMATPSQITVDPGASYFKEEWAEAYANHDPERSKKLLDEAGIVDGDGDGWRERYDGEQLVIRLDAPSESDAGINGLNSTNELVVEYWANIGVKVDFKIISRELYQTRYEAAIHDMGVWQADRMRELRAYIPGAPHSLNMASELAYAIEWADWEDWQNWKENGEVGAEPAKGEEPPQYVKDYMKTLDSWYGVETQEQYLETATKIFDFHAENIWMIGVVARPISPVIVNNRLHNVPSEAPFSDGTSWWRIAKPAQWYLK